MDNTPGVQTFLGAHGACPQIDFEGHIYSIGHPTQRAKAELEELAVANAVAEVRKHKKALPADAYAELFAELTTRIAAGDFRTWGPGWQRIVLGQGGAHLFLLTLLREHHPKAPESLARALMYGEPEQVKAAMVRVVPGFFSVLLDDLPLQPDDRQRCETIIIEAFKRPSVSKETSTSTDPSAPAPASPPPSPITPISAG